ncbi:DUF3846 domain-containing protein [Flindersiella endophytica]
MLSAIVIPADPGQPVAMEHLAKDDFTAYRRLVGGHLEVVNLERPAASLYLNEEGKLLELPLNARATALAWVHNTTIRGRDVIVGDAFILGPADEEGSDTTTPDDLVDLLFSTERYQVQFQRADNDGWDVDSEVFTDWHEAYIPGLRLVHWRRFVNDVRILPEPLGELSKR